MTLKDGTTAEIISDNVSTLLSEGRSQGEAISIAMEKAGKTREDSLQVTRYDTAVLESPERTAEGFLKADAFLTRAGIFEYRPGGQLVRELRPAKSVFDAASVETLKMKPVTDDHPVSGGRKILLSPDNTGQFTKGSIGENISVVGDKLRAKVLITDNNLIRKVEGGKNQLSCGYICDLSFESGVFDGKRYDAVQSNIRYNHVSVVDAGRAGDEVTMRIDSAEGETIVADQETIDDKEVVYEKSTVVIMNPPLTIR